MRDADNDLVTAFVVFMIVLMLYMYKPDMSNGWWIGKATVSSVKTIEA